MEIVEDSGFDSDHKTSASVPMADESVAKIHEVRCLIIYHFGCTLVHVYFSNDTYRFKYLLLWFSMPKAGKTRSY